MRYALLAVMLCVFGFAWACVQGDHSAALVAHKEACVKAGNDLILKSQSNDEPCWVIELRLDNMTKRNADCLSYWGDAGVDLKCAPRDGGAQ